VRGRSRRYCDESFLIPEWCSARRAFREEGPRKGYREGPPLILCCASVCACPDHPPFFSEPPRPPPSASACERAGPKARRNGASGERFGMARTHSPHSLAFFSPAGARSPSPPPKTRSAAHHLTEMLCLGGDARAIDLIEKAGDPRGWASCWGYGGATVWVSCATLLSQFISMVFVGARLRAGRRQKKSGRELRGRGRGRSNEEISQHSLFVPFSLRSLPSLDTQLSFDVRVCEELGGDRARRERAEEGPSRRSKDPRRGSHQPASAPLSPLLLSPLPSPSPPFISLSPPTSPPAPLERVSERVRSVGGPRIPLRRSPSYPHSSPRPSPPHLTPTSTSLSSAAFDTPPR
jgi:hypothetical protein